MGSIYAFKYMTKKERADTNAKSTKKEKLHPAIEVCYIMCICFYVPRAWNGIVRLCILFGCARGIYTVDRRWSTWEDNALRVKRTNCLGSNWIEGVNFWIYTGLANTSCNQLGYLGAEINNKDALRHCYLDLDICWSIIQYSEIKSLLTERN